jgi:hypothetical protein
VSSGNVSKEHPKVVLINAHGHPIYEAPSPRSVSADNVKVEGSATYTADANVGSSCSDITKNTIPTLQQTSKNREHLFRFVIPKCKGKEVVEAPRFSENRCFVFFDKEHEFVRAKPDRQKKGRTKRTDLGIFPSPFGSRAMPK